MVTPDTNYQLPITNYESPISNPQSPTAPPTCTLCALPAPRHITRTIEGEDRIFCCYGCQHIYEIIAPDLAQGIDVRQAMGQAGLDLNAPCCRGVIQGDPNEVAHNLLSRLMLNAFLAMMVMVLSLSLYSDFFFAGWGESGQGTRAMLQTIAMLFATPAVLMLALYIPSELNGVAILPSRSMAITPPSPFALTRMSLTTISAASATGVPSSTRLQML